MENIIREQLEQAVKDQKFVALTFRSDTGENVTIPCNLVKAVRRTLFDFMPSILEHCTGHIDRVIEVKEI
jgi:hypothetical protein